MDELIGGQRALRVGCSSSEDRRYLIDDGEPDEMKICEARLAGNEPRAQSIVSGDAAFSGDGSRVAIAHLQFSPLSWL